MAEQFPVVERGLFFVGDPGVGKTHLAVAILKQVILTRGARGIFYDTRDLLKLIRSTYNDANKTTELDVLRPVMEADLLVLDDLGAEKTSEWVEETLNLIVNTRYNERRATIFTSNYPDLPPDSNPAVITLHDRIGFRMRSRLHEMCDFLDLEGADYRMLLSNEGVPALKRNWEERRMRGKLEQPTPGKPPGEGRPARRRQSRPKMVGWPRWLQVNDRLIPNPQSPDPWAVRPRPVLQLHLQLLQFQSRPVRRDAEDAVRRGRSLKEIARKGSSGAQQPRQPSPLTRLYFGGGTPSLLTPAEIGSIIERRPRVRWD